MHATDTQFDNSQMIRTQYNHEKFTVMWDNYISHCIVT